MTTYAATFTAGTREIILKHLKQFPLEQLKISYSDNSFMIFSSSLPEAKIANFRFFNNIFEVIYRVSKAESLEEIAEKSLKNLQPLPTKGRTFKLYFASGGEPAAVKVNVRQHLIESLSEFYNLSASSHRPDNNFWVILRDSGIGLLALQLPHIQFKKSGAAAGALRPELAHVLGLVAGLTNRSRVLDPFAGSGAILEESLVGFHVREAVAIEKDPELVKKLKKNPKLRVLNGNATDLHQVESNSIDRIVTDPPWGKFEKMNIAQLNELYSKVLDEIARVLKPGGIAVVLSAAIDTMDKTLPGLNNLELLKSYSILVSGRKAVIYKLRRS